MPVQSYQKQHFAKFRFEKQANHPNDLILEFLVRFSYKLLVHLLQDIEGYHEIIFFRRNLDEHLLTKEQFLLLNLDLQQINRR
jgi:hypothetical protein